MGLIYSLVAVGVYISFRTLQFPDLTVDGSFPLGAAVSGACILNGMDPFLSTLLAMVAGAFAGYLTAFMATRLKMLNLLAGILTMTALYSINLRIMGMPNLSLNGENTIITKMHALITKMHALLPLPHFQDFPDIRMFSILLLLTILGVILMEWLLKTRIGLAIRATGSNARMGRSIGINDNTMIQLGLAISNALVALAGALFAQVHGFADVSMGVATIIIGLAAVIIGEAVFQPQNVGKALIACVIGAMIYRIAIAFALNTSEFGLQASDLNLVTALIVAIAMISPMLKRSTLEFFDKISGTLKTLLTLRKGKKS